MDLLDSHPDAKQNPDHDQHQEGRWESLDQTSVQTCENLKTSPEQSHIHSLAVPSEGDGGSQAKTETLCPPRGEREGEESEREETESSDDNTTQYSIHPPQDCPYLLLLQGCSLSQVPHPDQLASSNRMFAEHQTAAVKHTKNTVSASQREKIPTRQQTVGNSLDM